MTRTPSPEYRLVLSFSRPKAEQDIENILRHMGEQWGENQIPIYRDKTRRSPRNASKQPNQRPRKRAELPETHRIYPVASHVIVYRVQADVIGVIRILHKRMSRPLHI